jgi:hypothetical protein
MKLNANGLCCLWVLSVLAISCNTPNKPVARTIMIRGWVQKPGEYTISGELATLHNVIQDAGGLSRSYPESEYRACFFLNGKRIRERTVIKPTLWDTPLKISMSTSLSFRKSGLSFSCQLIKGDAFRADVLQPHNGVLNRLCDA